MGDENKILQLPKYDELIAEIQKLRDELSVAILEQDDLLLQQCKNIEAAYLLRFGGLEYAAYEAECRCLRYRRKLELVVRKRNRQEKIDIKALEEILDQEFKEYQQNLDEMIQSMNGALDRNRAKKLSKADTVLLKSMYRKILKALHPDLHPNLSEAKFGLFFRAVASYRDGNLETMQAIFELITQDDTLTEEKSLHYYMHEKEQLIKMLEKVRAKIAELKKTYPYILKEFLDDESKALQRTEDLEHLRSTYQAQTEDYKKQINAYLQ